MDAIKDMWIIKPVTNIYDALSTDRATIYWYHRVWQKGSEAHRWRQIPVNEEKKLAMRWESMETPRRGDEKRTTAKRSGVPVREKHQSTNKKNHIVLMKYAHFFVEEDFEKKKRHLDFVFHLCLSPEGSSGMSLATKKARLISRSLRNPASPCIGYGKKSDLGGRQHF